MVENGMIAEITADGTYYIIGKEIIKKWSIN
jgi:hypothetical protein